MDCPKLPWMVEFYSGEKGEVLNGQLSAAFATTTLEYLSHLNIKSKASTFRGTQLVCAIPAQATCNTIEDMIKVGMSVARISCPGNEKQTILDLINKVKSVSESYSKRIGRIYPLGLALDIRGTEIRIGQLRQRKSPVHLPKGKIITITTDDSFEEYVTKDTIYVDYPKLPGLIQPGDKLFLDHGMIRLSAIETAENIVKCIVDKAGDLVSRVSVTLPNTPMELPAVCEEDKEIVKLAIDNSIDFLFVSGICNSQNVVEVRNLFGALGDKIQIIPQIENATAIENIDDILDRSDGVYIDTEQLLLQIPKEKVFLAQKSILAKCNLKGMPVICPTNVSDSSSLSKAEICDTANSIIDGASALLIPQNACTKDIVKEVCMVCREAEAAVYQKQIFTELVHDISIPNEILYSLCISAVAASLKSSAAAIVCLTTSGRTAKLLSRFKPRCPVITVTRYARIARLLRLYKGVEPLVYLKPFDGDWAKDVEERVQIGITYGKYLGYIRMGDAVVTVTGSKPEAGLQNSMKIVYASEYDTLHTRK
ncbi:pyruvate kinase-like [Cylas formicarius]|uniref:pyruvate kinase-like n=1 Tax=Cylas formicarius TaxID=197179 RepID=UPI002958B467|nr:pyruvate kinase-like [Cylas formicarius]